jgi:hypothetical protein
MSPSPRRIWFRSWANGRARNNFRPDFESGLGAFTPPASASTPVLPDAGAEFCRTPAVKVRVGDYATSERFAKRNSNRSRLSPVDPRSFAARKRRPRDREADYSL